MKIKNVEITKRDAQFQGKYTQLKSKDTKLEIFKAQIKKIDDQIKEFKDQLQKAKEVEGKTPFSKDTLAGLKSKLCDVIFEEMKILFPIHYQSHNDTEKGGELMS